MASLQFADAAANGYLYAIDFYIHLVLLYFTRNAVATSQGGMKLKKQLAVFLSLLFLFGCISGSADADWACAQCGRSNDSGFNFCPACGSAPPMIKTCGSCNYVPDDSQQDFLFCPQCGAKLALFTVQSHPAKADIKVGNIICFGRYEQDNDLANGKEPIEWIVLDCDEKSGQALLLSKYCLEKQAFHHEYPYPTWEKSDMRKWLNGNFLKAAFTTDERNAIAVSIVSTPGYFGFTPSIDSKKHSREDTFIDGGPDTEDLLFLLSIEEVTSYIKRDEDKLAYPTPYFSSVCTWILQGKPCSWTLRSPADGGSSHTISAVAPDGSFFVDFVDGFYGSLAVRPALRLNVQRYEALD